MELDVQPGRSGREVALLTWSWAGEDAGCLCSPLHVANPCTFPQYCKSQDLLMGGRQPLATVFGGCMTTLGLGMEPKVTDVTSSSTSVSSSLWQDNKFES